MHWIALIFPLEWKTLGHFYFSSQYPVVKNSLRKNYVSHKFFKYIYAVFLKDLTLSVNNLQLIACWLCRTSTLSYSGSVMKQRRPAEEWIGARSQPHSTCQVTHLEEGASFSNSHESLVVYIHRYIYSAQMLHKVELWMWREGRLGCTLCRRVGIIGISTDSWYLIERQTDIVINICKCVCLHTHSHAHFLTLST